GVQYRGTSDSLGRVQLACGEANITVLFWMGLPINRTVSARLGSSVTVGSVGRLTIRVQDLLNRPLPQASVSLTRGRVELVGETGSDGSITADLPAGSYALSASKAGKSSTIEARVVEGEAAEVALTLDIILTIGGYGIGLRELSVAVGAAAITAIAVMLLRRRAKAVKTASEGGSEG
ncbi:MAG: carboxypeptidase-like regulatory domain-containing protein, partial [Thermofilaceae archaeon]